jgi:hypothetical protein
MSTHSKKEEKCALISTEKMIGKEKNQFGYEIAINCSPLAKKRKFG